MRTCSKCNVELTDENGYRHKSGRDAGKFCHLCRKCQSVTTKKYFQENPLKGPLYWKKKERLFRERINLLKLERGCYDCGGSFPPEAMDFDHLGNKKFGVATGAGQTWDNVRREIDKCQLVCACCHRVRTQKRHLCTTPISNQ